MAASSAARQAAVDEAGEENVLENSALLGSRDRGLANEEPESIFKVTGPLSRLILYFMAIHFLLAFAEIILVAPLIKLFENSLCLKHYEFPQGGVQEEMCKIPEIQVPLATIRGWKSTFDTIPVLLIAVPMGKLGDRHGRRRIMALTLLGVAVAYSEIFIVCAFPKVFPLQLIWLSSFILLCGGGLNSASAFMWAMASESIPPDRRSHAFYHIFSAFYVAELISSYVASVTTDISPWISCSLSLGSVFLCLFILIIMPDPRKSQHYLSSTSTPDVASDTEDSSSFTGAKLKISLVNGLQSALSNRNILLTIPVFLVGVFRYTTLNFLIQYASIRFHINISTGATFYTETAAVNIVLFLFVVPQSTAYIRRKYNVRPQVIDLFLVRTSVTLMCLGCLAIGAAPSARALPIGVFIFASGFGSRVSALGLITYWISADAKATLYASIVVLESLGHAIGDPLMAQIFAASMRLSPFWTAMPFFFAATLYFVAVITTRFVRIDKDGEEEGEESTHQD